MEWLAMHDPILSGAASLSFIILAVIGLLGVIFRAALEAANNRLNLLIGVQFKELIDNHIDPVNTRIDEILSDISRLDDKFDKFMTYERENVQAHSDMNGRINDLVVRVTQTEGQQQSISVQMGIAHISASPPSLEDR